MDFSHSERVQELRGRLQDFMAEAVYPAEAVYEAQSGQVGPHVPPPVIEELKAEARKRGLWNLFLPDERFGAGLSNVEYAPLAEITGRSVMLAPEAINCSAPDAGNMEILAQFGTDEQQAAWLAPLLDGEIRSCFAMTEPEVASSDATNIATAIRADGDDYVIDGRKWWTTGLLDPRSRVALVMGVTDENGERHRRHSLVLVPLDTPGVRVVRDLTVFGYTDWHGHGELELAGVRVPCSNIIGAEGDGFAIVQARLGPGRIHHSMRAIGLGERALELMVERATSRNAFGGPLSAQGVIQTWIAESRIELDQARLLVMNTAWLMDTVGAREARIEIAAIKVAAARAAGQVIDRAIQVFGGAGLSGDFPLARAYALARSLRLVDGPDEVHLMTIARQELRRHRPSG
ncbi:MAG TPA: acyl-CoA dehydrogenase family protein [Gaiellaceae bacterium]|jgi:acyl-CoA dehydrogenase|nr:acyl-CoA dehydrogenase family protein [Gaiellaceae bacterium]